MLFSYRDYLCTTFGTGPVAAYLSDDLTRGNELAKFCEALVEELLTTRFLNLTGTGLGYRGKAYCEYEDDGLYSVIENFIAAYEMVNQLCITNQYEAYLNIFTEICNVIKNDPRDWVSRY